MTNQIQQSKIVFCIARRLVRDGHNITLEGGPAKYNCGPDCKAGQEGFPNRCAAIDCEVCGEGCCSYLGPVCGCGMPDCVDIGREDLEEKGREEELQMYLDKGWDIPDRLLWED